MDKILVTGVAGFIGSNLAHFLLENENCIIYGLDNFSSSTMSNLYPLLKNERFHFIEHDLVNEIPLSADYIYHCAGCGDFKNYFEDKYEFTIKDFDIFKNIIEYTRSKNANLLTLSQFFEYEDKNKDYFQFYDLTILKEGLLSNLILENKINAKIVRLGEVYGKNMLKNDSRFIPSSIIKALNNEDIKINSNIKYSFQYIDDVVQNLAEIMNLSAKEPIINLTTSSLFTQKEIAQKILSICNSNSSINENIKENDKEYYFTYSNKDNEMICKTAPDVGLSSTVEHFKLMYFS